VALRQAVERLLSDPDEADRLGRNGREWVLEHAAIERYADEIAAVVDLVLGR
jgi:glycosyltransferase involved in cell wall biosynthesis